MYTLGDGVEQDFKEAINWHTKGAEKEIAGSQFSLGIFYVFGKGVPQSYEKAAYWINLAREQKYEEAEKVWNAFELWKY
jgi:TPR repeat protein